MRHKEKRINECFCNKSNVKQFLHMVHTRLHTQLEAELFLEGIRSLHTHTDATHTRTQTRVKGLSQVSTPGPVQCGSPLPALHLFILVYVK